MCPKKGEKKYKRKENLLIAKATYQTGRMVQSLKEGTFYRILLKQVFSGAIGLTNQYI
jgi:hypothetical protein